MITVIIQNAPYHADDKAWHASRALRGITVRVHLLDDGVKVGWRRHYDGHWELLQIRLNHLQHHIEIVLSLLKQRFLHNMIRQVPLDYRRHESVHGTPNGGNLLKDSCAIFAII